MAVQNDSFLLQFYIISKLASDVTFEDSPIVDNQLGLSMIPIILLFPRFSLGLRRSLWNQLVSSQ
jgi:hypothetical protein